MLITNAEEIIRGRLGAVLREGGEAKVLRDLLTDPKVESAASRQLVRAVANGNNYEVFDENVKGIKYVHYKLN